MSALLTVYREIFWRPLFNLLVWLYTTLPWQDLGFAIIVLTILIRLILIPLTLRSRRAQQGLARLQPEIQRVQERHQGDREAQGRAMMELYSRHRVNPFSGCLLLIIQLPILIALFQVFQDGFDPQLLKFLYQGIPRPEALNPIGFGWLDLSRGNLTLGVVAAVSQYFQSRLAVPVPSLSGKAGSASMLRWQTLYLFPGLILVWSYTLPAALTLYWTVSNFFGIVEEYILRKHHGPGRDQKPDSGSVGSNGVRKGAGNR